MSIRDDVLWLDVYTWTLAGPGAHRLGDKIKYPGEREGTVATELLVGGYVPTFELAATWPGLAEHASDVATFIRGVDSLRCRLDRNLKPFGYRVVLNDDVIPSIVVRRSGDAPEIRCGLSTDRVRHYLRKAKRSLPKRRYETAIGPAVASWHLCPELAAVNRLLGTLQLRGVALDDQVASAVCRSLARRCGALQFGVAALTCMWTNGPSSSYELAAREAIAAFNDELEQLQPVFQMAMARVSQNLY